MVADGTCENNFELLKEEERETILLDACNKLATIL
jgi:hypothetical protein